MSREDYVRMLAWFAENHAQFVPEEADGFPAHWLCFDGSYFLLSTIEECESFEAVQELVMGAVAA